MCNEEYDEDAFSSMMRQRSLKLKKGVINMNHVKLTDKETYNMLKQNYAEHPDLFMHPDEWKKLRKEQLNKERKNWS